MERHYVFTGKTKNIDGAIVCEIRCTVANKWAKVGQVGGYIGKHVTMSPGTWVTKGSVVLGNVSLRDSAVVKHSTVNGLDKFYDIEICGAAQIVESRLLGRKMVISDNTLVSDSLVMGNVTILNDSVIFDKATIDGVGDEGVYITNSVIRGTHTIVRGYDIVVDSSTLDRASVFDKARVYNADLSYGVEACDSVCIRGRSGSPLRLRGAFDLRHDAKIESADDVMVLCNAIPGITCTAFRTAAGRVRVVFSGFPYNTIYSPLLEDFKEFVGRQFTDESNLRKIALVDNLFKDAFGYER